MRWTQPVAAEAAGFCAHGVCSATAQGARAAPVVQDEGLGVVFVSNRVWRRTSTSAALQCPHLGGSDRGGGAGALTRQDRKVTVNPTFLGGSRAFSKEQPKVAGRLVEHPHAPSA